MFRDPQGELTLSPTDLVQFLGCPHATQWEMKHLDVPRSEQNRAAADPLLIQRGQQHEQEYLTRLLNQGRQIAQIAGQDALNATLLHLRDGVKVIYQAELRHGRWLGRPDFLFRVDTPSCLGRHSYEPADTKFVRSAQPEHIIQLSVYAELLAAIQGIRPKHIHVVLDGFRTETFLADDFAAYVRLAQRRLQRFVKGPPLETIPEPCAACPQCDWREHCQKLWENTNHLSLLAGLRSSQRETLRDHGIHTVEDLARCDPDKPLRGMPQRTLRLLQKQAQLHLRRRQNNEPCLERLDPVAGRGLQRLPPPQDGDLFFDMEGDPLYPNGGLEYLFGVGYYETPSAFVYRAFWAHTHDEERRAFAQFMAFLESHFRRYPNAFIYHYNHYEPTALKRLASRYRHGEDHLDQLLRLQKFVDLYRIVRQALLIGDSSYSLKVLEPYYGFERKGIVATAADSIIVYNQYRNDPEANAHLLQQIEEYNRIDCESTAALRHWLLELRPRELSWFEPTAVAEEPNQLKNQQQAELQDLIQSLQARASTADHPCRHMVDLLEFHRREEKPAWWSYFDRREQMDEELIDDLDCLIGLELEGEPKQEKQSLIYTYRYPPQETKIRVGDTVNALSTLSDENDYVGIVVELNEAQCIIRIKRGKKRSPLPRQLSIDSGKPIKTDVLREALRRVAEDSLHSFANYPVAGEILSRSLPKLRGRISGEPILRGMGPVNQEALAAVAALDNSYLFIQGPPGAGKTHISADLIVELMRQGKRIGVSANSHMAINNLLKKVEATAIEKDFEFRGVKKCSDDADALPESQFISNVFKVPEIEPECALIAGTAWLFADEKQEKTIDVLFIDEAGQVSLANVIAMATAAKNIVLVGDQMQLGQPIQGTHPGQAGQSILEFLLEGRATVPPERGIFLGETWRLRPELCEFVSRAFYESRLKPHASTSQRQLRFDHRLDELRTAGIHFHPVHHVGCSQRSEAEAMVVKDYYDKLLGQTFVDHGDERRLTEKDILVVTPYNAQVNLLSSRLPQGARVGTVDKFQGQEAPVVLISMVASSGEDVPRGIEFLLSAQRLNVAVSRAQCLAVVVASPRLLAVPCRTIEQLRLANKFCLLAESGGVTGS
ncbi:MAG: TM0106 family RecB-like putative nuclease [Gemmataceae bacterium]|nr:TM0106 family RecB-like putative nuclease [Gemmataceae bacterium]